MLEEVKEIIEGRRDPATNTMTNGDETSARRHASEGAQLTDVSQLDPEPRSQRVIQNFRSLFSPYPARSVPGPSSSARNNSYRPPPPKKPKKTGFFQVKETWTHDFFCLASKTATIVPPRTEKISLPNAGLGRRKVVFPCRASAVDVLKVLENVYLKLKQGGGFELLRSRSPASMLSFLRDAAGLGQALAYIRPLQKDLPMDAPVENTEQVRGSS